LSTIARLHLRGRSDITSDDKLVRTLILLFAACEQTATKQADVELEGLGDDLEKLSGRLRDVLGQDPGRWLSQSRSAMRRCKAHTGFEPVPPP
jgi:hypothetical protein